MFFCVVTCVWFASSSQAVGWESWVFLHHSTDWLGRLSPKWPKCVERDIKPYCYLPVVTTNISATVLWLLMSVSSCYIVVIAAGVWPCHLYELKTSWMCDMACCDVCSVYTVVVCPSGSALVSINEVNLHQAQLLLGWVSMFGFNSHCGIFISVCDQPPRSTQPGHPFMDRCN